MERTILELLMLAPGRVHSREELIGAARSGGDVLEGHAFDAKMERLRKQLNKANPIDVLQAVRGAGYVLNAH